MKNLAKPVITILCALLLAGPAVSQAAADTIETKKTILGTVFKHRGQPLRPKQMLDIMRANPEAYDEMKAAYAHYVFATVIGGAGGFLFGWPLGAAAAGGEFNVPLFATGTGIILASIPFTIAYSKKAKKAVKIYNASLGNAPRPEATRENSAGTEAPGGSEAQTVEGPSITCFFYYTRYSKMDTEVCIYKNETEKACLVPDQFFKMKLPLQTGVNDIYFVSSGKEYPLEWNPTGMDPELILFKFRKNGEFFMDNVDGGTKRDILGSLEERQEVK